MWLNEMDLIVGINFRVVSFVAMGRYFTLSSMKRS